MIWFLFAVCSWAILEGCWYTMHRALHLTQSRYHEEHHELYTHRDFMDVKYREPSPAASLMQMAAYGIPALAYSVLVAIFLGWFVAVCLFAGAVTYGKLIAYVHDAFHLRGHWLERFMWFHRLRMLHWVHHLDDRNFGILTLLWDWFFLSYEDPAYMFLPMVERDRIWGKRRRAH